MAGPPARTPSSRSLVNPASLLTTMPSPVLSTSRSRALVTWSPMPSSRKASRSCSRSLRSSSTTSLREMAPPPTTADLAAPVPITRAVMLLGKTRATPLPTATQELVVPLLTAALHSATLVTAATKRSARSCHLVRTLTLYDNPSSVTLAAVAFTSCSSHLDPTR